MRWLVDVAIASIPIELGCLSDVLAHNSIKTKLQVPRPYGVHEKKVDALVNWNTQIGMDCQPQWAAGVFGNYVVFRAQGN